LIRVSNIKISINDDIETVKAKTAGFAKINKNDIRGFKIVKESIDARKKSNIILVYQTEFECDKEDKVVEAANNRDVVLTEAINDYKDITDSSKNKLQNRPIIIGSGPAGLFAGLILAKNGYKPIIFERGSSVEVRDSKIKEFFTRGVLDTECNIQFGEGGAGTYSDGKLTTRIKDPNCEFVINEFINAGAPKEIAYSFKPHIGTDILKGVVKNIRNQIINLGGEVRFDSKITDVELKNGKISRVRVNGEYDVPCEAAIFALGHSARDTYEMLFAKGVCFEQKPFAIGVRIEHLQSMIDESQYGLMAKHPKLRGANYKLAFTSKISGRACYSFCMCPGGVVVAAASESKSLVINGMSEYSRDKINGNSALVVGVGGNDFKSAHPLAGVEFQRHYEKLAYTNGGSTYAAPVQLVGDFMKDQVSKRFFEVEPSYTRGYVFSDLRKSLPNYVTDTIKEGLMDFDNKIRGFASYPALLTGIETRTSSPVRIVRDAGFESVTARGIYPAGEGAGYAGGIMSAAADGIKVAQRIIETYSL
jgi:uncharacterized protein